MDLSKRKRVLTGVGLGLIVILGLIGLGARGCLAPRALSPSGPIGEAAPGETASPAAGAAATAPALVYDPTKLLDNGVPAAEVYDKEPRTDAWADAVEAVIGTAMTRDLQAAVPEAGVVIKCKTLSCLIGVDAPAEKREGALNVTKFLMLAPWVVELDPEEDGTMRWLFFQEPRFGDAKTFVEWFQRLRKKTLTEIRAGEKPNPFPLPLDKVPTE